MLDEREKEIKDKIKNLLYVAGVDEAGAGPMAGDLVVSAVILDPENPIDGLTDSKKLSKKRRNELFKEIKERALDYSVVHISPELIDEINIFQARMQGFIKALNELKYYEHALIDGNKIPKDLTKNVDFIIKGDFKFQCISAASIIAKVTRDQQIIKQSEQYPQYGFEKHKGYGTKEHKEALLKYGPSPIHRKSYKPVQEYFKNI